MTLEDFVLAFAEQFDETPVEEFNSSTDYKELDEWSSLTALSIIALVKENFDKKITGAEIRNCASIEELYKLIQDKE